MPEPATGDQVQQAERAFQGFLRTKGLKLTRSRREILLAVMNISTHFQAEELLLAMHHTGKRAAKATIYRTLPLLIEAGIIKRVRFGSEQTYYEHCFGEPPHDHLVCRQCGAILEFESGEVVRLCSEIARRHHFEPETHRFQIVGLCMRCAREISAG
jgi:Fur family ferric uptake transcriptional regulator